MARPTTRGFTLIELMIAVAIVAILAAIAYPSYTQWVAKSRRTDAKSLLHRVAANQEKFFTQCGSYTTNFGGAVGGCGGLGMVSGAMVTSMPSDNGYYSVSISLPAGPTTFAVTAKALGNQLATDGPRCDLFTLNQTGLKGVTGSEGMGCWQ